MKNLWLTIRIINGSTLVPVFQAKKFGVIHNLPLSQTPHQKLTNRVGFIFQIYSESDHLSSPLLLHPSDSHYHLLFGIMQQIPNQSICPPCSPLVQPFSIQQLEVLFYLLCIIHIIYHICCKPSYGSSLISHRVKANVPTMVGKALHSLASLLLL